MANSILNSLILDKNEPGNTRYYSLLLCYRTVRHRQLLLAMQNAVGLSTFRGQSPHTRIDAIAFLADIFSSSTPGPANALTVQGSRLSSPLSSHPDRSSAAGAAMSLLGCSFVSRDSGHRFSRLSVPRARCPITVSCSVSLQHPSPTHNSLHSIPSSPLLPTN